MEPSICVLQKCQLLPCKGATSCTLESHRGAASKRVCLDKFVVKYTPTQLNESIQSAGFGA